MTALIIHGHFYQPPRENPWTGTIDAEPTAQPFHDWNERVYAECYQPNSAVRIVEASSVAEQLVNNYAHISFDFGPTLLSWLERNHPETYERIIAADAESARRRNGHGNAVAQAYNHAILPLCNERDRRTQVRWGLADFRYRFGREPEAMWLPETACNDEVLGLLIDEGLRFVILAPQQAARVRKSRTGIPACPGSESGDNGQTGVSVVPSTTSFAAGPGQTGKSVLPSDGWQIVDGNPLDTSIPYNYFHRDGSGRSIAVFFYDQQLAQAIAFQQALASSSLLTKRIVERAIGTGSLVNVATDGESYGHHHKFGELCLAYALQIDAPAQDFAITNYGEYLDQHPPEMEVEISNGHEGEGTSWSCTHGVSRWIRDCGCHTGGAPGGNQSWRGPLRDALDFLRDQGELYFESTRGELFIDPWSARDEAISLILDERASREAFLNRHAPRPLGSEEQGRALLFLELQRNLLLMYTSCGWFFNDISGIEPIQILKYACRAIDLMNQLGLASPREQFLEILAQAKSNRSELGNGADIYRTLVEPANPSFKAEDEKLASTLA
jgi:alpha-amylase/alpha-mannosidase (GH57 family)